MDTYDPSAARHSTAWTAVAWREIEPYLDRALDLEADRGALETWLTLLSLSRPDIVTEVRTLLADREALNASGFLLDPPFAGAHLLDLALEDLSLRVSMSVDTRRTKVFFA
jgi:hypothetical protein